MANMANEEAIKILKAWKSKGQAGLNDERLGYMEGYFTNADNTAFQMAIDALKYMDNMKKIIEFIHDMYEDEKKSANDYVDNNSKPTGLTFDGLMSETNTPVE